MKHSLFGIGAAMLAAAATASQTLIPDVAPAAEGYQVIINIPQQRLFLFKDGSLHKVYPVGVGRAMTQTNIGEHKIGAKAFNPTWHIPKSIQRERGDGVTSVPPGPKNPLGPVFVRLGNPRLGLGIHGTSNPASVPGVVSHGCVRMKSPDALEFARTIHTGSPATVSYERIALNQDSGGNLWLAVYKDPYRKGSLKTETLKQSIAAWASENGRSISPAKIDAVVKAQAARPVCLTCTGKNARIQGSLVSLAWKSGTAELTSPRGVAASVRPDTPDEILPEGSAIEIDAADTPRKATQAEIASFKGASVFDDEGAVPLKAAEQQ